MKIVADFFFLNFFTCNMFFVTCDNIIKKKKIRRRVWIIIKLIFFINLEIMGEEDKKKKNYMYFF